ncbi:MAG TPA: hypothetical protein VEH27_07920 [Methylomirabilota bacterium]|nr:hypothetical protein [Methylomirabilota bacterium]
MKRTGTLLLWAASLLAICLATAKAAEKEYLVYQPRAGAEFTVKLLPGRYQQEWFNIKTGVSSEAEAIEGKGGEQLFSAPFRGEAVLWIKALAE